MSLEKNGQPLVSILINNYNYGSYLGQAIDSALNQTYPNVEVIVVDDGSTDHSQDVMRSYKDRIVAVFKDNGGQASALNSGFAASKGDIICFFDSDDIFLPEKVEEVVKVFTSFPSIDWFFHDAPSFQSHELGEAELGSLLKKVLDTEPKTELREIDFRPNVLNAELPTFAPSTSNICLSRQLSEKIFPLPEEPMSSGIAINDLYIKLLAVGLGKGCQWSKYLCVFRLHKNNNLSGAEIVKRRRVAAEMYIATAYWMRVKWADFNELSNKLLSRGFALHLRNESKYSDNERLIKEYFSDIPILEKIKIYSQTAYYFWKLGFVKMV